MSVQSHDLHLLTGAYAVDALTAYLAAVPKGTTFGNGRVARKIFEEMVNNQASRLAADPSADSLDLRRLTATDHEAAQLVVPDGENDQIGCHGDAGVLVGVVVLHEAILVAFSST